MAFVFRSERQTLFKTSQQNPSTNQNQQFDDQPWLLNSTDHTITLSKKSSLNPKKIIKGLVSAGTKDKKFQPDLLSFEKESKVFQQHKDDSIKINPKRLKTITQNFFFSSNVPRDAGLFPFDPSKKYKTCNQFKNLQAGSQQILKIIRPFQANKIPTTLINKSLLDSEKTVNLIKSSIQRECSKQQSNKIIIDCSKQTGSQMTRKSSSLKRSHLTDGITFLKKANIIKHSSQQRFLNDQSQNYLKISTEPTLKKKITSKKLVKLRKGILQDSLKKNSDSESSQSEDEFDLENDNPGPGTYDNIENLKNKKSFRSKQQKFVKIFISPLERFKKDELKYNQVTYINQQTKQTKQKNQSFLSKTPKNMNIEIKTTSPPPGAYDPRETIEHNIVKNLLRSANVANFNSSLPRFLQSKQNLVPGPGSYNIDSLEHAKKLQIRSQMSPFFKSQGKKSMFERPYLMKENRNQKNQLKGAVEKQFERSLIHKRQQTFDRSQFFSPAPFLSRVQRFLERQNQESKLETNISKIKGNPEQKCGKNLQAFNSSSKRNLASKVGEGVGVGSYCIDKDKWNKKSYNVYFH